MLNFVRNWFSRHFSDPQVIGLAIVLLFEPLRQRLQGPVDRFFFAERLRLRKVEVR